VREDPVHLIALPLTIVVCCVLAAVLMPAGSLSWILLPFFAWQFHHFQRQNLGLIALSASSSGVDAPPRRERRIVMTAGVCGIAGLIADPNLLQLGIYRPRGDLTDLSLVVYAALVVAGLFVLVRRDAGERPPSYCAIYTMALLFPLPIFLFRSPYAAVGGMTIGHGLQYLILVGLVATGTESSRRGHRELVWLAGIALAGGGLLAVTSHFHASDATLFRGLFGVYLGVVCSHFVVDARLWRLSRPFSRSFLGSRIPYLVPRAPMASPGCR
jgi:hypothetical protein